MKHSKIQISHCLNSLSDSRMTSICDLRSCLHDHVLLAAGHCLHSSLCTLMPLISDSVSPSCYYTVTATVWVVPWIPHHPPSKLLDGRINCFPFFVTSSRMFSFQTVSWTGCLWPQSWQKNRPTCACPLQTIPWGPATSPTKIIQISFLKKNPTKTQPLLLTILIQ